MSTGVVPRREVSQEQLDRKLAAELKIVEDARAESRTEAAALEQMKQHVREAFLSGGAATEEDFERCWPELRNEIQEREAPKHAACTQCRHEQNWLQMPCERCGSLKICSIFFLEQVHGPDWREKLLADKGE